MWTSAGGALTATAAPALYSEARQVCIMGIMSVPGLFDLVVQEMVDVVKKECKKLKSLNSLLFSDRPASKTRRTLNGWTCCRVEDECTNLP